MGIVMDFCGKHRTEDKWSPCGIRYIIHKSISLPYQKLCRKKAIQTFFRNQYITNNIVKVNTKYYRCLMTYKKNKKCNTLIRNFRVLIDLKLLYRAMKWLDYKKGI